MGFLLEVKRVEVNRVLTPLMYLSAFVQSVFSFYVYCCYFIFIDICYFYYGLLDSI